MFYDAFTLFLHESCKQSLKTTVTILSYSPQVQGGRDFPEATLVELLQLVSALLLLLGSLIKVLDQLRDIFLISLLVLTLLSGVKSGVSCSQSLVRLGELSERGKRVGAELVEDTGDELGEFLVLTVTVDGEGVGGESGVDCEGSE